MNDLVKNESNQVTESQVKTNVVETPANRFTNAVMREFGSVTDTNIQLTPFQKKLIQNYFIKIDMILQEAELKRLAKNENYRDKVAVTWQNVNLNKLAIDVITYSSVGLDPTQPNHLNPIPFKNSRTGKYDIGFIMGYRGIEIKARKYGLDVPDRITVELVYKNDHFKQIKKDKDHIIEEYEFEVKDPFNRGDLVGGFYYHDFGCDPKKNKLEVFNMKDIEKRIPKNASAEFWGGEKALWENGQKVGTEKVEGWREEMAWKTLYRAAYNDITIDSEKIDKYYLAIIERETENRDSKIADEINNNASTGETIGFKDEGQQQFQEAEVLDDGEESKSTPIGNMTIPKTEMPEKIKAQEISSTQDQPDLFTAKF